MENDQTDVTPNGARAVRESARRNQASCYGNSSEFGRGTYGEGGFGVSGGKMYKTDGG